MEIYNDSDSTLINGTASDDTITNSGFNVSINSGAGNDTISLGSDSREYVALAYVSNESIGGFEVGTLETSDAIYLADGDLTEIVFDFTPEDGFSINMKDGSVFIEASSDTGNVVDMIIDDKSVRAVGDSLSTAFDSAVDYYRLGDATTLTGATGTINVNDMTLESKDELTILGYTTTRNGVTYNFVDHIYGVTAGNSLTIKNYSGDFEITYSAALVDDSTAQITRSDTNKVVWTGTPAELEALDFMEVDKVQYFLDKVEAMLEDNISSYITLQDNKMTVDFKSLREKLDSQLAQANEKISSQSTVNADVAFTLISDNWYTTFGIRLEQLFSENVVTNIKNRLDRNLKSGKGIYENLLNDIDSAGLFSYIKTNFSEPLKNLGLQVTAEDIPAFVDGNGIIEDTIASAIFDNVFINETVAEGVKNFYDRYKTEILDRIKDGNNSSYRLTFELDGSKSTVTAGLYTSGSTSTLNALAANNDINFIVGNKEDSASETIIGSNGDDWIFAGAGDSVNSGEGNDTIVFANGSDSVVTRNVNFASVGSFADFVDRYFVRTSFEDDHTRQFVGLGSTSSDTVIGFETGTEDYSDAVYLMDGSLADLTVTYDSNGFKLTHNSGTLLISSSTGNGISTSTSRTPQSSAENILVVDALGNMHTVSAVGSTLNNTVDSIVFTGTLYENNITNSGSRVTINAGDGNDTVTSSGTNNVINGGTGNDSISSTGDSAVINGGTGADTISSNGASSNINGGDGDDNITNNGATSTINGGAGADTITSSGNGVRINGEAGNDSISNDGANATISGGAGNDYISNSGSSSSISGGEGADNISNSGDYSTISGGDGNDFIANNASHVTISGDIGNDYIYSVGDSVAIEGGAGNNSIYAKGDNLEISIGRGNDYVSVNGSNNKIVPIRGYSAVSGQSNTIIASGGDTTIEGYGGTDFLVGNGKTYFELDSYSNVTLSAKVGDTVSLNDSNTVIAKDARYSLDSGELVELEFADSSGDDYVRVFGGENISLQGGKDTIEAPDAATITGYDLSSGMVFVTDFGNVTSAVRNGYLKLGDGTFGTTDNMVTLEGYNADRGNFVNFMNNGSSQLYGWTNERGMADGTNYQNAILIATKENSTLLGGAGNDTLYGGPGDYFNGGAGNDLVVLDSVRADDADGATVYVNLSSNETLTVDGFNNSFGSGGDKINGINLSSAEIAFSDGVLTIKNGRTSVTVNNSATVSDSLTPAIGGAYEYTRAIIDNVKTAVADEGNVIKVENESDNLAVVYVGSNAGVDLSDFDGNASVTLSDGLGSFGDTAVAFAGINKLKAGKGSTTLIGGTTTNTLVAGEGATSIWGGSSANDYLVGLGTDQTLATSFFFLDNDGNDTIDNFNFKTSADDTVTADEIRTVGNVVTDVKISGDDVTLGFTRSTDKLVIKDAVGQNFQIEGVTAQVANTRLNYDGVADYYQAVGSNATVSVAADVDSANIWLNNWQGAIFVGDIVNLNASAINGNATLVGNDNNNTITASGGDSSLWGGGNGNDLLVGGNGEDMFFYFYGNGNDTIRGASSVDRINLNDVDLTMIADASYTNGAMNISFTDGNSLVVENYAGSTFSTKEGNFVYNRSSREWTQA